VRDVGLDLEDRNRCTLGAEAIGHTAPKPRTATRDQGNLSR
jgi:hypothetical protein